MIQFLIFVLTLTLKFNLSLQQCSSSQPCLNGACCSQWGFCGYTALHCGTGCLSNCPGAVTTKSTTRVTPQVLLAISDGSCSLTRPCTNGACCSQWGFCGYTNLHCGTGCMSNCAGAIATSVMTLPSTKTAIPIIMASTITSSSKSSAATATTSTQSSNTYLINKSEFLQAAACKTTTVPTDEQYTYLVTQATAWGGITTKREMAMFLAQILWESDGLVAKREYACLATGCPGVYNSGTYNQYPSQSYYGRGYIQLVRFFLNGF